MAFRIDENGNITMVQGDTGRLVVNGLNTDQNYTVYFAIQDENRRPVGNEVNVESNMQPTVVFELASQLTDLLKVAEDEETHTYYYGVKTCTEDGFEDTLSIGGSDMGDKNTITVYPKKVEGC
jgi:hypothetical protein